MNVVNIQNCSEMPYLYSPCAQKPNPCGTWAPSSKISYGGPNLPCTGIQTCDTVEVALQKIDNKLCPPALYNDYYALFTAIEDDADPEVTVLENAIGTVTWTWFGVGTYRGLCIGCFPPNAVVAFAGAGIGLNTANIYTLGVNAILLVITDHDGNYIDNGIENGSIHIRKYITTTTTTTAPPCTAWFYNVALYNCSNCGFFSSGTISNSQPLTTGGWFLFPGGFKMQVGSFVQCNNTVPTYNFQEILKFANCIDVTGCPTTTTTTTL